MNNLLKYPLASLSIALLSTHLSAQEAAQSEQQEEKSGIEFLVAAGLTFGGDDLVEIDVSDGPDEELNAGGLFDLRAGTAYRFEDSPFALQFTIGYHFDSVSGEDEFGGDADFKFSRFSYELLARYHINKHQLGLGVIQHTGVELELDGLGLKTNIDYDDATGFVAEYAYWITPRVSAALRYADITYEPSNTLATIGGSDARLLERDGSHIGIYGIIHF